MLAAVVVAAVVAHMPPPVRGDFDHDGRPDVAEIVPFRPGVYHLVIWLGAPHHPVFVVDTLKQEELAGFFLDKAKPGRWRTWCGKGGDAGDGPCHRASVRLRGDTLAYGTKESSEAVAIWTGRRFEAVWLSD
jgi:hypothetical protein